MSRLKQGEVRAKLYSRDPKQILELQEFMRSNYTYIATSRIQGPDIEGAFWGYVNIFLERS